MVEPMTGGGLKTSGVSSSTERAKNRFGDTKVLLFFKPVSKLEEDDKFRLSASCVVARDMADGPVNRANT